MIDVNVFLIDWLEGKDVRVAKTATKAKPKCICCKKRTQVQGRRGNCLICYRVFAYEKSKLRSKKAQEQYDAAKVAEGKILPSDRGRTPDMNNPMRKVS